MQERVLGALIIGGIALAGLAWGAVEGTSALIQAKNDEKTFEKTVLEKVKKEFTSEQSSKFDCRMVRYTTVEDTSSKRGTVVYLFVDVIGYTSDKQVFTFGVVTTKSNYVTDAQNKKFDSIYKVDPTESEERQKEKADAEAKLVKSKMSQNVYENYTVTTSSTLTELLNEKSTVVYKYAVGDETKYEVSYSYNEIEKKMDIVTVVDKK